MFLGKVVGSIVSTRKSEKLIGNKFMIVRHALSRLTSSERVSVSMYWSQRAARPA